MTPNETTTTTTTTTTSGAPAIPAIARTFEMARLEVPGGGFVTETAMPKMTPRPEVIYFGRRVFVYRYEVTLAGALAGVVQPVYVEALAWAAASGDGLGRTTAALRAALDTANGGDARAIDEIAGDPELGGGLPAVSPATPED